MIKNTKKKGFTLVELLVVLTIMGIIIAIAVPSFINYWRSAEFRKNESNAKTIYLAAESKLTYYRSSGQWEKFKKQVKEQGKEATFFKDDASTTYDESQLNGRIYAITLDAGEDTDKKKNAVLQLIDDYIYDKDMMKGSIGIEIDIETGEVYSAFYGTKCKSLTYDENDNKAEGTLTMQKRDYDSRRERLLGYYSTEDTTNVVKLKPTRLRITTISLQNSEKLSLNWSSNVGNAQDVSYEIKFYKKSDTNRENALFSMTVSPYELRKNGWSATSEGTDNLASIQLKDKAGNNKGNWTFPLTYSDNKYSLVLDAMMSAKVQSVINEATTDTKKALEQTSSTSICRLAEVNTDLKNQQDIYATIKATGYTATDASQKIQNKKEYRESEATASNSANTMYADKTSGNDVKIATFRHLSNIRYYNKEETDTTTTKFTLTNKNMEWTAVGTGVYDFATNTSRNTSIQLLKWTESSKSKPVDFPTIATLKENYMLEGNGTQTLISNLKLGENSIVAGTQNLGLFGEVKGTIDKVALKDATLELTTDENTTSNTDVQAVGILAGRNEGTLSNITIQSTNTKSDTSKTKVNVTLTNTSRAAVGGIVGMLSGTDTADAGQLKKLTQGTISNATMQGTINATLPTITNNGDNTETGAFGIGGIVGYVNVENNENTGIKNCENHADVSGNYFTGGIAGKINGSFVENGSDSSAEILETQANISESSNDGLILCTTATDSNSILGRYFGGIVGYGNQALIYSSTSASGRASGFTFDATQKEQLLKGTYVGGIIGFGQSSLINSCSTQKNGYILGSDDVGGIAGGFSGNVSNAIRADGSVSVTTNASYVIGNSYVGGIVGRNSQNVTLTNCINNGVAAGYKDYVGGIVGYNDSSSTIQNCASYLSDYDNSIFNMITENWKATANYAGGIAGYNNGAIIFEAGSEAITVKSVSSIVVGKNYVGGVAGFNDINGNLDVNYTLIGGRIYGYGDCVGGGFGFNASEQLLTQSLAIKPRSVEGRYYVGGCIGANVVNLSKDITMDQFRADNILGTITGDAFCGGIIGYQRTYTTGTEGQLNEVNGSVRASVEANKTNLLPELNNNVPTSVSLSNNPYKLTIATRDNSQLLVATNNIPLQANIYVGGIVGYCEKNSNLIIKNCKNTGNISNVAGGNKSVSLQAYTAAEVGGTQGDAIELHLAGGIISANLKNQVIDHCTNSGSMSGYSGTGGVVGLNAGLVVNCTLSEHFGNATLSYLGGIAGINAFDRTAQSENYVSGTKTINYQSGLIQNCSTSSGKTISGKDNIGGIVGWNLQSAQLKENTSYANITASGNQIGGISGRNSGVIFATTHSGTSIQRITSSGTAIGGLIGVNEIMGTLEVEASGTKTDVVVIGNSVTVNGYEQVGGIVGVNHGQLESTDSTAYIVCQARQVRASHGTVGGIVGMTDGDIVRAINKSGSVIADAGQAGGITATNDKKTISNCDNYGNVTSSNGYAGGIVATNDGIIQNCHVGSTGTNTTVIYSLGTDESGVISAVNTGTISNSTLATGASEVKLQGDATKFGGITGKNEGIVTGTTTATGTKQTEITKMPTIESTKSDLTVGGAVGENLGTISYVKANGLNFENFRNYQYLGGIAGINGSASNKQAVVTESSYSGTMSEGTSAAGNCYGGIAGINYAVLEEDNVGLITMNITGVYTATSTSTEEQKEASASHAGGITGKNETTGEIQSCTLEDNPKSSLSARYGMLGGVTGFNKGVIYLSGSESTSDIFNGIDPDNIKIDDLDEKAQKKLSSDDKPVDCSGQSEVANMKYYNTSRTVSSNRLGMSVISNGNLGGITAYNGGTGKLTGCVSGDWFLVNKSEAIGVGTGGIIGMNESEKDLNGLVNGAFVGRQLSSGATNRFAGGIIGNQNNSSSSDWTIANCINYGMIYCFNTHYSGGIMGQWTGTGGTIQNCRNYGNMQTTYMEGWVGASGGVVAQLYHAYEENEYNIIGCLNAGNIYGKTGENTANCANDSAGILGNVTNYRVNNVNDGQRYKIQVLDCVNASGVKVYSKSMASGVVGFFSCDLDGIEESQKANVIEKSTQNIELRIERCQNYAEKLMGDNFSAGIFGDRYGWTGCQNTTVTDCYSVNCGSSYYNHTDCPIYSFRNGKGQASFMKDENKTNNYFIQATTNWDGWQGKNVKLDYNQFGVDYSKAQNTIENTLGTDGFWKQYAQYEYLLTDETNNRFFIAAIYPGHIVNSQWATITENGYIVPKNNPNDPDGKVLFYLDESYNNGGYDKVWDKISAKGSNYAELARESYRSVEGIKKNTDGTSQILEPKSASATIENGKINVNIVPQNLPNALKNEICNPFQYNVKVSDGTNEKIYKLYTESGNFDIPENMSGNLTVSVQSVSMFDDVSPSQYVQAVVQQTEKVLPTPDVRVELVRTGRTQSYSDEERVKNYSYRFTLNNIDAYEEYSGWQVKVNIQGGGSVTLDAGDTSKTMTVVAGTYQMTAQAITSDGRYENSSTKSVSVFLPQYRPLITLQTWNPKATPNVDISGDNLENLSVNIELDGSNTGIVATPPVYRAELVGTWNGESDIVFAQTDMLTVSNGKATASFTNLPEYISKVNDLKVRIWYAQSGLGPVYAYYDVSTKADANVKILESVNEDKETWKYQFSTSLESYSNYFDNYKFMSQNKILTWLPAPNIKNVTGALDPVVDADGNLKYTFSWDSNLNATESAKYKVSLTGIDADNREVTIDTSASYTDNTQRKLTIDGSDWNYKEVRLKVTRIGDASQKKIGLSSTETFEVKQRLGQPGQPIVENIDENELNYRITWSPISSEEGCAGYQAYIQTYDDNGTLGTAKELGNVVKTSEKTDGKYTMTVNLENYAGKRAVIYLVAKASTTANYLDSAAGVTYELQIPNRLPAPDVTWSVNWTYDKNQPIEADDFNDGGLQVKLKTNNQASIPPGGSAYLMKAFVYNSEADAEQSDISNTNGSIAEYPGGNVPIQMDVTNAQNYYHNFENFSIKYAGKYIVFYARISSGGGNVSSHWTESNVVRLPYVKLAQPTVASDSVETKLSVKAKDNPDFPQGEDKEWTAQRTQLTWESIESANVFTIDLNGNITDDSNTEEQITARIRVVENDKKVDIQQYVQQKKANSDKMEWVWKSVEEVDKDYPEGTAEKDKIHTFKLDQYQVIINSTYKEGKAYTLNLMAELDVQQKEDGGFTYTLKMPDITDVVAHDDEQTKVTHSNFSISSSAIFRANVTDNLDDKSSDEYVESKETEIKWN